MALRPGDAVTVSGPGGRLGVPQDVTRVAFLMGGVGVAPARAIIRDRVLREDGSAELVLFYGNNTQDCVPFDDELRAFADRADFFRLVEVIARPRPDWEGERGFITPRLVEHHIDPHDGWYFIVAGPPAIDHADAGRPRRPPDTCRGPGLRVVRRVGHQARGGESVKTSEGGGACAPPPSCPTGRSRLSGPQLSPPR